MACPGRPPRRSGVALPSPGRAGKPHPLSPPPGYFYFNPRGFGPFLLTREWTGPQLAQKGRLGERGDAGWRASARGRLGGGAAAPRARAEAARGAPAGEPGARGGAGRAGSRPPSCPASPRGSRTPPPKFRGRGPLRRPVRPGRRAPGAQGSRQAAETRSAGARRKTRHSAETASARRRAPQCPARDPGFAWKLAFWRERKKKKSPTLSE